MKDTNIQNVQTLQTLLFLNFIYTTVINYKLKKKKDLPL